MLQDHIMYKNRHLLPNDTYYHEILTLRNEIINHEQPEYNKIDAVLFLGVTRSL